MDVRRIIPAALVIAVAVPIALLRGFAAAADSRPAETTTGNEADESMPTKLYDGDEPPPGMTLNHELRRQRAERPPNSDGTEESATP